MQLATVQLIACSMQLATKAITTAIKLATLQQNGRSITCTMVVNHWSAEARFALFISLKFSENLREIKSGKCASVAYTNHAKIDEEFDDMFNLHYL